MTEERAFARELINNNRRVGGGVILPPLLDTFKEVAETLDDMVQYYQDIVSIDLIYYHNSL
jgi:hypothetical protein